MVSHIYGSLDSWGLTSFYAPIRGREIGWESGLNYCGGAFGGFRPSNVISS